MPDLMVADPRRITPLDPLDARVEVWRDQDGTIAAYGRSGGGRHRMDIPRVASFRFKDEGDQVVAIPEPFGRSDLIEDAYRRMVLPMVLHAQGTEVLHASAVLTAEGVLGFCGVSGAGKSTIAYAMSRAGYRLWGDDAVAFDASPDSVTSIPLPFQIWLRPASAAYLQDAAWTEGAPGAAPPVEEEPVPLSALFVLSREPGGAGNIVDVRRLSQAEAFRAVLVHAYSFTILDQGRKRRMIDAYLRLVTQVPVHHLAYTSGLGALPHIVHRVTAAIGA